MLARRLLRLGVLVALVVAGAGLAGCGAAGKSAATTSASPGSASAARDRWGTVWLCRPGVGGDPCVSDLATSVVTRSGAVRVEPVSPARTAAVDCFYVYPTISDQRTINANLTVGFRERAVAVAQAARFSQVCRVYAPVYRQITLYALAHPSEITVANLTTAYDSVRSAFHDYLAHYNHGRGIVFIGHSQGAAILIRLLRQDVDKTPLRRRLVSALLLGGNLTATTSSGTGGGFAHIPACHTTTKTGCVVAYSSFTAKPPPNSPFGRTTSDAGVPLLAPRKTSPKLRIMCVNPASPAGGTGTLEPVLPTLALSFLHGRNAPPVHTPWVAFPDEYSARCRTSGNATWLQISDIGGKTDRQPRLTGRTAIGLHVLDLNIALGNLVQLVAHQAAAYT